MQFARASHVRDQSTRYRIKLEKTTKGPKDTRDPRDPTESSQVYQRRLRRPDQQKLRQQLLRRP